MSLRHSVHPLRDSERHTTSLRASPTSLRTSHYVTQNIPYVTQSVTLRHSEHPIRDSEHLTTSLRASPTWLRTSHYVTQNISLRQNITHKMSVKRGLAVMCGIHMHTKDCQRWGHAERGASVLEQENVLYSTELKSACTCIAFISCLLTSSLLTKYIKMF